MDFVHGRAPSRRSFAMERPSIRAGEPGSELGELLGDQTERLGRTPGVLLKNGDRRRSCSKARCVELVEDDDQVSIFP